MTPSRPSIERIKAAVDLPAMVREYTPLRAVGGQHVGSCVFHKEDTPSMRVHDSSPSGAGFFVCFGCGAKGDAVSFLSRIEGISPMDALRALSERTGISLDGPRLTRTQRVYDADTQVFTEWWWKRLTERLARRVTMYVAWGTEEEADAAGLLWRQVSGLNRDGQRRMCLLKATEHERGQWKAEVAADAEFGERWMAVGKYGFKETHAE